MGSKKCIATNVCIWIKSFINPKIFTSDQIAYIEETFGLRNDQCDNILNDFQKLRIIKIQVTRESFGFLKPTVLTKSNMSVDNVNYNGTLLRWFYIHSNIDGILFIGV